MTSSTLTGDRRWASARRGGMTVLGKVAVPKPINLPSQKLENHGLDPNVEIVPKGTLSWGSRPSSAGSNAWGTSTLSPSTDGGSSSPSHLVGRPSSGGGTRPSTAGSEKAHDSNASVWGSNSRPSSASGVLASNHTSTSLRPCSAEKRPGSSHLSRFAEPAIEGSGVWSATSTSEKMGVASSAKEGFSLSTGDFPTLGSEKDESKKNMESLDHSSLECPGSSGDVRTMADSRGFTHADDVSRNPDIRGNSWRKDGPPFVDDGLRPSMERWHGEPHMYPNPNMAPQYESWRGVPPVNPPGGVWFRGPPGPPYGGPIPSGGFPMDPFPYYHPHHQAPAPRLASSQQILQGAVHHGHQPNNGDMPRMPHVPHMHPGMPMRPGFYPGPVPYDGYYRPPMGFCNPSDQDLPFMGMPPGPPVYSRHANQSAPDLNNAHPRPRGGRGPEHFEPGHLHDPHGPYKVPMNPNDGWNQKEEEKWGHRMSTNAVNREKGILSKAPLQENAWGDAWGDDYNKDENINYGKNATMEPSSINPSSLKVPERLSNIDEAQMNPAIENVPYPREHSLIQKIEGLNAKARAAGGKQEGFHMEEPNDKVQFINAKDHQFANGANADVTLERHPTGVLVPVPLNSDAPMVDKDQEPANASVTASPRKFVRGTQNRSDPHAKARFHGQEADGGGKKIDSQPVLESRSRSTTNDQVECHDTIMSNADPSDMQRAKMREIAKQRAIQLQKEEEERVREQKAKALAKLEELNRRSASQGVENSSQKETIPPPGDAPKKPEFSRNQLESSVGDGHSTGSSSAPFNVTAVIGERNTTKTVDSGVPSKHLAAETQRNTQQEDEISSQNQLSTDANVDGADSHKTAPQGRELSRQKRGGYKQRQYAPPEKNIIQDAILSGKGDVPKDVKVISSTQEVGGSFVGPGVGKEGAELPVHKKKANNKSDKYRQHKVEESSHTVSSLPKNIAAQANPEVVGQDGSDLNVNPIPDPKDATQSLETHATQHHDDYSRVNNAWKPQHARKPRNTQGNRASDKTHNTDAVFWAPVRSHNKIDVTDQMNQKSAEPLISSATGDNSAPNNSKTKRAEMERYVPKPVAKELAQQGSIQQPSSPSFDPPAPDGSGGKEKASHNSENAMNAGANMESKHVDGKSIRHHRAQGSWRQRGSTESTAAHSFQDSSAANTGKDTQTTNGSQINASYDGSLVRGPPSRPDEHSEKEPQISICDGWGDIVNDPNSNTSTAFTVVKDHGPSGRGKRHSSKGQRGGGSHRQNRDHKDSNAGLTDLQSSHAEAVQSEKMSSKEARTGGDHSASHWQPKSQGYVAHNQQGHRSRGSQSSVTEESLALKRESGTNSGAQSAAKDLLPASEGNTAVQGKPIVGHHEAKRERRVPPVKGRPHSSQDSETLSSDVEPASFGGTDVRNEQHPHSGYRKNMNYNARFNRGHEPRGDWSSTAQENKQHNSSGNRERQRQNSHYEYQPVGPYNGSGRSNEPVNQTENQSGASKFRERGHGHSRRGRGNSYGRQSGNE